MWASRIQEARVSRSVAMVAVAAGLVATSCGKAGTQGPSGPETVTAMTAYADLANAQYTEALNGVGQLRASVDAFLAAPTASSQLAAQKAWRASRPAYLRTETFRFYGGPIDNPDTGREGFINAWPLDEAYIDYVEGDPTAGIINKPEVVPTLTVDSIADQNERGGETNISTGYHAIEFLLWGQDADPAAAGKRPPTDFTPGGVGNADRRRQYLRVVTDLLVTDLKGVVDAWAPTTGLPGGAAGDHGQGGI